MPRIVLVTGAFGVLGSALVKACLQDRETVIRIDAAAEGPTPGGEGLIDFCGIDLTDDAAAAAAVEEGARRAGGLDVVFNVAGGFSWLPVETAQASQWRRLFEINLMTTVNVSRAALPSLKASASGRIVNVGANGALKAGAGMGPYAASKAAVHRFTESLAEELKTSRITVNAVLPSVLDTPANRKEMPDADPSLWVSPGSLAGVMRFLASGAASDVTGSLVPVTGRV
jgi:NAD(P)-dependent dehydrogenase (short-subunit alcohol dehydrogenase family)